MSISHIWFDKGVLPRLLAIALTPMSWLYRGLAFVDRLRARRRGRQRIVNAPTIVVGNLIVGGAGKTPTIQALIGELLNLGLRPGVISRGYGRERSAQRQHPIALVPNPADPRLYGDEPTLISKICKVPVAIGNDRYAAAKLLLRSHPEVNVILSDDGLQHLALPRNIELVVFDSRGAGNGRLLPAGPLREPLTRLKTVDAVIFNFGPMAANDLVLPLQAPFDRPKFFMQIRPRAFVHLVTGQTMSIQAFVERHASKTLYAIAGIGHPERFFSQLRDIGLSIQALDFPDHHRFTLQDLPGDQTDVIVMTGKDAIKCEAFSDERLWWLDIAPTLSSEFSAWLKEKLDGFKTGLPTRLPNL